MDAKHFIDDKNKIIVEIPGIWATREDVVHSIEEKSRGFLMAGLVMTKIGEPDHAFEVLINEYDDELKNSFKVFDNVFSVFTADELREIDEHSIAICVFGKRGSLEDAYRMMDACAGILHAGGLGVSVVSSGVNHPPGAWLQYAQEKTPENALRCFLMLVADRKFYYTCGMHCFGLPDVICYKSEVENGYAGWLLKNCCHYILAENPVLNDGEVFTLKGSEAYFRIKHAPCSHFEPSNPYFNPHGIIQLHKMKRKFIK